MTTPDVPTDAEAKAAEEAVLAAAHQAVNPADTADLDQMGTFLKNVARLGGTYFNELILVGIPEELAMDLTRTWMDSYLLPTIPDDTVDF